MNTDNNHNCVLIIRSSY